MKREYRIHPVVRKAQGRIQTRRELARKGQQSRHSSVLARKDPDFEWVKGNCISHAGRVNLFCRYIMRAKDCTRITGAISDCSEFPAHVWNIRQMIEMRMGNQHCACGREVPRYQTRIRDRSSEEVVLDRESREIGIDQNPFASNSIPAVPSQRNFIESAIRIILLPGRAVRNRFLGV